MNENNVKPEQKARPLIVGKETITRLKVKSSMKAGATRWTQTSVCSFCTP